MKILIVEDQAVDLYMLKTLLSGSGYEVVTASNGVEALERLRESAVDLIISDVLMPVMDGFTLCREVKDDASFKEIPFVFYSSSYTDEKDESFARGLGASIYITKPTEPAEFMRLIKMVIHKQDKGFIEVHEVPRKEEEQYLTEYNERLIAALEKKVGELEIEEGIRKNTEDALRILYEGSTIKVGGEFFDSVATNLTAWLGANCVMVGALKGEARIETLAMSRDGELKGDFCYDLTGSPCQEVLEKGFSFYSTDICKHFPDDLRIKDMKAEGYVGIPIKNRLGEVTGVLCAISREPMVLPPYTREVFTTLAARVSAEIERNRAEELTRVKTAYLESILSSSTELAIAATDKDFRITYYNALAEKNHGYTADEVLGKTVMEMHTKEHVDHARFDRAVEIVKEEGEYKYEITQERDDGTHYLDASISGIYDDDHELVGYLSLARDITKRKASENELRESEEKFRIITSTATASIIMVDESGRVVYWNDAAENTFGYSREEAMGKPIHELIIPQDYVEAHLKAFEHFTNTGEGAVLGTTVSMEARRKDGSVFYALHSISGVKIKGRWHAVAIITDITERVEAENKLNLAHEELKESQQQMMQQEKMASIGQLAAGAAHEINNPMAFVSSNLQTLSDYAKSLVKFIEVQEKALKEIKAVSPAILEEKEELDIDYISTDIMDMIAESLDGASRVNKIVQDLKVFSREERKDERNFVDIHKLIDSIINIVWNEIKYKATLELEYGELPSTWCYEQELGQVFMNLLINAAQAIEKEGVITVSTHAEGGYIYVNLSDTGSGIAEENIDKILNPFFTTKEVGQGTGLGLSISYDIVKKHNGDLTVESKVGEGTTFTVKIPVVAEKGE